MEAQVNQYLNYQEYLFRTLKYSDHIIEKVHADVIEKIKKSPYRKILERLNNVDVDNI